MGIVPENPPDWRWLAPVRRVYRGKRRCRAKLPRATGATARVGGTLWPRAWENAPSLLLGRDRSRSGSVRTGGRRFKERHQTSACRGQNEPKIKRPANRPPAAFRRIQEDGHGRVDDRSAAKNNGHHHAWSRRLL